MKTCRIYSELPDDQTNDQYSIIVPVCDECVAKRQQMGEKSGIVQIEEYDPNYGDICEFCEKSLDEELAEKEGNNENIFSLFQE